MYNRTWRVSTLPGFFNVNSPLYADLTPCAAKFCSAKL
jgi:hypothetical protein